MTSEAPERHKDITRNRMLNQCLLDLNRIVNEHDPERDTSVNNEVWDRLDKLSCDLEEHFNDHALALVAEAYEKAAVEAQSVDHFGWTRSELAQMIRSLIPAEALAAREARDRKVREEAQAIAAAAMAHPTDAQAALDARDKQVREEALREFACDPCAPLEKAVLHALPGQTYHPTFGLDYYSSLQVIADDAGVDKEAARFACKRLRDKRLAQYQSGLFTENGEPAGSGYALTDAGRALIDGDTNE